MYFKLCASLGSSARTQRGGWGAAGDSFWQMYGKHPCRGRRPAAPAAAPHFSPDVRRIRSRHCREGACPFRQQPPRQAPPSGESANVSRIHRRAFHVLPCAARKGQALSLQGNICEFAEGGGIGKVLLPACRVGTPYNCACANSPKVEINPFPCFAWDVEDAIPYSGACANSPGVESNMFTTAAGYDVGSEKTAQSGCALCGRGCAVCVSG